jgi:hypothetical protein
LLAPPYVTSAARQRKGSGTLGGVVLGPDDRPVANASVSYQSSAGTAPHAVYTDRTGHFAIHKLASDNYDVRASAKGVFSEWAKNVTVRSGQATSVTLRLVYARQIPKAYTKSQVKR